MDINDDWFKEWSPATTLSSTTREALAIPRGLESAKECFAGSSETHPSLGYAKGSRNAIQLRSPCTRVGGEQSRWYGTNRIAATLRLLAPTRAGSDA